MEIKEIDTSKIDILENIRQRVSEDDLAQLMSSIKESGLMQPIGVKEAKGGYILVWGFRRLTAFKKLGYKTIPAIIFKNVSDNLSEEDFLIANASENIHRKDVDAIELGRIVNALRKDMSYDEIAVKLSIAKSRVTGAHQAFMKVPAKHRGRVKFLQAGGGLQNAGKIGNSLAQGIVHLRNVSPKQREEIFDWALKEGQTQKNILLLGHLLNQGLTLKQAQKELESSKSIVIHLAVKGERFDKILEEERVSQTKLVKNLLNKKYPDLVY